MFKLTLAQGVRYRCFSKPYITVSFRIFSVMSKHERSGSQDGLQRPSTKRAKQVDENPPMEELSSLLDKEKSDASPKNILHWFRSKDVRMEDNKALDAASKKAKEAGKPLLTCYLYSPKDLEWHGTSPARSDFLLESLRILQKQLKDLHIPLAIITAEEKGEKNERLLDFVKDNDISHMFANFEYEFDELKRDVKLMKQIHDMKDLSFSLFHDQTIIEPAALKTGGGGPHKVFTPYHKNWLAEVAEDPGLLDMVDSPAANDAKVLKQFKQLFDSEIPSLPTSKQFESEDDKKRIRKLWPPGHEAAKQRLDHFLKKKVENYAADRSNPAKDMSSRMSAYFSAGIISIRETLTTAMKANGNSASFTESEDPGIASWVREIVFREFYRHMMVITPHNAMNLPQNLKFDFVQWEDDHEGWEKWCNGTTGVPFVDAGMRQLNTEAYMHNRLRMNTASYLRANILYDYRHGERYFAEHLIDWDLCNNTQGWEPSYTVFNPVTQAEKNDPNGDYIRRWVPELKNVEGKAVFDPYARLSKQEFEKLGYPKPHVDFHETKERAVARYKRDLAEADP